MSTDSDSYNSNTSRPEHRLHDEVDPVPGVKGASPAADYSTNADALRGSQDEDRLRDNTHHNLGSPPTGRSNDAAENNAFDSERPVGSQGATTGGVHVEGHESLREGQPGMGEKLHGKTEKVYGKLARNPDVQEKGALREAGGKPAVDDLAQRASYD